MWTIASSTPSSRANAAMRSATSAGSGRSTSAGVSIACTMRERNARSRRAVDVATPGRDVGQGRRIHGEDGVRVVGRSLVRLEVAVADLDVEHLAVDVQLVRRAVGDVGGGSGDGEAEHDPLAAHLVVGAGLA